MCTVRDTFQFILLFLNQTVYNIGTEAGHVRLFKLLML